MMDWVRARWVWVLALLVAWAGVLLASRLSTDANQCDGWCVIEHASFLVIVLGLPAAIVAIWQLALALQGTTLKVGFAVPDGHGGSMVSTAPQRADSPPKLVIASISSDSVRNLTVFARFPDGIGRPNLKLVGDEPKGESIDTNRSNRAVWKVSFENVYPNVVNVAEISLVDLPNSMNQMKIDLSAHAVGMRGRCQKSVTLIVQGSDLKPVAAPTPQS